MKISTKGENSGKLRYIVKVYYHKYRVGTKRLIF